MLLHLTIVCSVILMMSTKLGNSLQKTRMTKISSRSSMFVPALQGTTEQDLPPAIKDEQKKSTLDTNFVININPKIQRYLVLGIVPIVWGTYPPLVKHLFETSTISPPPIIFNLLSYAVSYISFEVVALYKSRSRGALIDTTVDSTALDISSTTDTKQQKALWRGGIELGVWLFLGSICLVTGIEGTTATRAAILVQLTTVMVPILDAISNRKFPNSPSIFSCVLAAIGVVLVTVDTSLATLCQTLKAMALGGVVNDAISNAGEAITGLFHFNFSDALVIMAASFYSIHVVRLGHWSSKVKSASNLARIKSLTQCLTAVGLIIVTAFINTSERIHFAQYFQTAIAPLFNLNSVAAGSSWSDFRLLILSVLWNGAICTGLTMWAQSFAQRVIPATQANIVYTTQPVWAAMFSTLLLSETISPTTLLGGGVIAGAVLVSLCSKQQ